MPRNDIRCVARKIIFTLILPPLKSQNFDAIKPHKYTVPCGGPVTFLGKFLRARVRVANLAFDQTNSFYSFVCLLLVCSFSPKVQKYLLGTPSPIKRREFDEIVVFSAGSEKSSVLGVHDFSGSAEKAKYRELSPFYKKNFGRAHVCSPRRLPEIISKCYDCGNAAC